MNVMISTVHAVTRRARALMVSGLSATAKLIMILGVRLYARGFLSAVEMRFMLALSSALNDRSIQWLTPGNK